MTQAKTDCIDAKKIKVISDKADDLTRWLTNNAPYCQTSQRHLEEGTVERAYWHYGYVCGIRDVLALLNSESRE